MVSTPALLLQMLREPTMLQKARKNVAIQLQGQGPLGVGFGHIGIHLKVGTLLLDLHAAGWGFDQSILQCCCDFRKPLFARMCLSIFEDIPNQSLRQSTTLGCNGPVANQKW